MFFGILIKMYFFPDEHNPPHFHAEYQNTSAIVNINTCDIMESDMSSKHNKLILAWAELHKEELLENWKLCELRTNPNKIKPLK